MSATIKHIVTVRQVIMTREVSAVTSDEAIQIVKDELEKKYTISSMVTPLEFDAKPQP